MCVCVHEDVTVTLQYRNTAGPSRKNLILFGRRYVTKLRNYVVTSRTLLNHALNHENETNYRQPKRHWYVVNVFSLLLSNELYKETYGEYRY